MAYSNYSGAWRRAATGRTDVTSPLGAADSSQHMSDWDTGSHGVSNTAPARLNIQSQMKADYAPDTTYDPTDQAYGVAQTPPSVPMDTEPFDHGLNDFTRSESNPSGIWGMPGDVVQPASRHYVDMGVPEVKHYDEAQARQFDQKDQSPRGHTNSGTVSDSTAALKMGRYGYPEMNPVSNAPQHQVGAKTFTGPGATWAGSPREGFRMFRFEERKFPMHYWKHTARPLNVHTAHTANDAPPGASVYTSPFEANAQARFGNYMKPITRRQPEPFDLSAINSGDLQAAVGTEQLVSWGL